MKKLKLLLVTAFLSAAIFAQTDQQVIQATAQTYMNAVKNKDIDKMLDAMLPDVFEMVNRNQLKMSMEQMFNNPNMIIEYLSAKIFDISETVRHKDNKYARINYDSSFKMLFPSDDGISAEENKSMLNSMKSVLESQFGKDSIVLNYDESSVTVNSNSYMYAVSSPKFDGWKFINDDNAMGQLAKNIIPAEVISVLKK
ncbi:hypothetical protein FJ651_05700 [Paucihalobacter ruber]|uniref:Uncharacterized protein n=1 Tax=Paucihalobacter ruber TaxID=2567861 RepID=A0A506PMR2_9FLAO|nr:hypothetical protein [Paucihalobacter ruber]TPV35021.1 hypothetical protein FJ651_05700 [Paucihalobacter ruber]